MTQRVRWSTLVESVTAIVQVLEDHLRHLFQGFLVATQGVRGPAFLGLSHTGEIRKSPQMIRYLPCACQYFWTGTN